MTPELIFPPLEDNAAQTAFAILSHPGSLWFDAATVARLVAIEARGTAEVSDAEWCLLRACHEAMLLPGRHAA